MRVRQSTRSIKPSAKRKKSTANPTYEDFCGFGTHHNCAPFLWERGVMTSLADARRRQWRSQPDQQHRHRVRVCGEFPARQTLPDPTDIRIQARVWINGKIMSCRPLPATPTASRYQQTDAVRRWGRSGTCTAFNSNTLLNLLPVHALLWSDGKPSTSGTSAEPPAKRAEIWRGPSMIVVKSSASRISPATQRFTLFLDQRHRHERSRHASGGCRQQCAAINERGDVVGISLDQNFNPHAFLWEDGVMNDLN